MWILSLIYNETTSHRALLVNSATKVGRSHEYKADPTCVYIADLKVPKTYVTLKVGAPSHSSNEPTPLSAIFESICTTDVNGEIFKLAKRDDEPFEHHFDDEDLTFKINANKSDRIKLRLRWIPIVTLPFSKKIQFDGIVQSSPIPELLNRLTSSGIDLSVTVDPFQATHYVAPADIVDYSYQIAVSRAIPIVSKAWCEFVAAHTNEVESWLISVRSDLVLSNKAGSELLPNIERRSLLSGSVALVITGDTNSKQATRLKMWLECLAATEVIVETPENVQNVRTKLSSLEVQGRIFVFMTYQDTHHSPLFLDGATNNVDDLWNAVVDVDISKLTALESQVIQPPVTEKRITEQKESTPFSQRRKRRKLERVEDTNFFSFTPLSSSNPPPENILQAKEANATCTATSPTNFSSQETLFQQLEESDKNQTSTDQIDGGGPKAIVKSESPTQIRENLESQRDEGEGEGEGKKIIPLKRIVPEVSLADAIKSTKRQAEDSLKQELEIGNEIENQLNSLLIVEDLELKAPNRDVLPTTSYFGRKNFKAFRKKGPKQNNITRTFIELVDSGDAVYFKDSFTLSRKRIVGDKPTNDLAKEMDEVRGYQPEDQRLFVNEASESEQEDEAKSFQFSSKDTDRNSSSRSSHSVSNISFDDNQDENLSDDDEDEVRFSFTRKA